jgi:hypothetical protein
MADGFVDYDLGMSPGAERKHQQYPDRLIALENKIIPLSGLPDQFFNTIGVPPDKKDQVGSYGFVLTMQDSRKAQVYPPYSESGTTELVEGDVTIHIIEPAQVARFPDGIVTKKIPSVALLSLKVNSPESALEIVQIQGADLTKTGRDVPMFSTTTALAYAAEELIPLLTSGDSRPIDTVRIRASWTVESLHSMKSGQTKRTYEGTADALRYRLADQTLDPFYAWHTKPVAEIHHHEGVFIKLTPATNVL